MSETAAAQQPTTKISSQLKRNACSTRKVTSIDLRANEVRESIAYRRSFKVKTADEENAASSSFDSNKSLPDAKAGWKNSKLFSKTLSSIGGNRNASKINSSTAIACEYNTSKSTFCTNISDSKLDSHLNPSSIPSLSSMSSAPSNKSSEWKLLKSKLSLLRKKDNKQITGLYDNNTNTVIDVDVVDAGCSTNKHHKGFSLHPRSISPSESNKTQTINKSHDEGIVCKKEDLMHLILKAGMKPKSNVYSNNTYNNNTSEESTSPTSSGASASFKRLALKKQRSSGSQSSDKEENVSSVRRSNSCGDDANNKSKKKENSEKSETNISNSNKIMTETKSNRSEQKGDEELCAGKNEDKNIETAQIEKETSSDNDINDDKINDSNKQEDSPGSSVQWDEINFVDPNLLGDAIQAFLRGLGNSSVPTNEKRVSFKKSF